MKDVNENDSQNMVNPNPDFLDWNFHKDEDDLVKTFNYSTNLESLRISLNTLLKKSIKTPFSTNAKKAII